MVSKTLADWLSYIEQLHPVSIELGLARVNIVKQQLALNPDFPLITVAGTNGKGSTCAMLEAILTAAGFRVGCYTSPHLLRYNERVRVDRNEIADAELIKSFEAVEAARGQTPLTYFEFGTLAALLHFKEKKVEVAVLEVGLGGRLDAVNAFDSDCAIVTSIAIDHVQYLGNTRESIGFEKAGVFRANKPAICADLNPPQCIEQYARQIGAQLFKIGVDFGYRTHATHWDFHLGQTKRSGLPYPALRGTNQLNNASAVLTALNCLGQRLPVNQTDIRRGLLEISLPARFQILPGRPMVILDVAHNPEAAQAMAASLGQIPPTGNTIAVFGMLSDKDISGVIEAVKQRIDTWLVADIRQPRGATAQNLAELLRANGVNSNLQLFDNSGAAFEHACQIATENDKIVVFGSFYTVAEVLPRVRRDK